MVKRREKTNCGENINDQLHCACAGKVWFWLSLLFTTLLLLAETFIENRDKHAYVRVFAWNVEIICMKFQSLGSVWGGEIRWDK